VLLLYHLPAKYYTDVARLPSTTPPVVGLDIYTLDQH